jgi:thiol-disulfide isomerase/thioredoxin
MVTALLAAVIVVPFARADDTKTKVGLEVGNQAPEIVSKTLKGDKAKLSGLKGKVVVIDIWATWCPPCRAMIPHERELVKRMKDKPFALVSISLDAKQETLDKFLEKEKMPWTHWFNGTTGAVTKDYEVKYIPAIFVLDQNGVIRYKGVRGKQLDKAVDELVKKLEDSKKSS